MKINYVLMIVLFIVLFLFSMFVYELFKLIECFVIYFSGLDIVVGCSVFVYYEVLFNG